MERRAAAGDRLDELVATLRQNYAALYRNMLGIDGWIAVFEQSVVVVPLVLCAPRLLARLAQLGVLWLRLSLYRRLLWPRAALRRRLLSGIADAVEAEPPRGPPPVFAMPNFDLPPALFLPAAALYDLAHAPELLQPGLSMLGL